MDLVDGAAGGGFGGWNGRGWDGLRGVKRGGGAHWEVGLAISYGLLLLRFCYHAGKLVSKFNNAAILNNV